MIKTHLLLILSSLLSVIGFSQVTLTDSNLPIIIISTNGGVPIEDDPRVVAHMGIIDNGTGMTNNVNDPYNSYDGRIEIEIRGSTSQQYPKKGYGFETQDSLGINANVGLLGLPVENDWILYGPYPDKTLIRNVLTFDLAREMGHYASNTRYCELVINGNYRGLYVLMERIKIDNDRVDIKNVHVANQWGDSLTGGYIVKVDKLTGEVGYSWTSNYNNEVEFQFHDPEFDELNNLQASYMEDYINDFEAMLAGPQFGDPNVGYHQYIDIQSFHDFFILQELGRTVDGYRSSSFLHKDKDFFNWNSKLVAGPMWDFNLSYGNADYCDADLTTGWQYEFDNICNFSTSIPFWWERLLEDPSYVIGLRCRWESLRESTLSTANLHAYIDSVALEIQEARIRNFQRWPIIGVYVNWNGFVGQTYQEDLDYLKTYIAQRAAWLDANIPGACVAALPEVEAEVQYHRAWPNPFTHEIAIGYSLFENSVVEVAIVDISGRKLKTIAVGEQSLGMHAITLDLSELSKGSYIYTITTNSDVLYKGQLIKE